VALASPDSVSVIDGQYNYAGRAAAYLIQDGDEAAYVDNVTRFSVPYLIEALEGRGLAPEQVRYLIVTHVHLDHCGGTAELAKACPDAEIICHPRAARHIVDPSRLVAGAKGVYGEEEFARLYGEIEPVEESRVRSLEDEASLSLGGRTLHFTDAPGHAPHHFVLRDSATNSMFAGDAFGVCYRQLQGGTRPYLNFVCAPPQFDVAAARTTIQRIVDSGVERVFVTHFGLCTAIGEGAEQLLGALDKFDALVDRAAETDLEDSALLEFCSEGALKLMGEELRERGLDPEDEVTHKWATSEHKITAQGLATLAQTRRS